MSILTPVLALITWTLIICAVMYARRIPAIKAAKIAPQDAQHPGALNVLPSFVRAAADNYNHLHEQPTLFYALAFYSHLVGVGDTLNVICAWVYVALRIVHSVVQITVNMVLVRFSIFVLATAMLFIIALRNILALT